MKLGLYGYGRMGQTVERIARARGDDIVWKVRSTNAETLSEAELRSADVIIEFSQPDAAFQNIRRCLLAGVRVISGTTGWLDQLPAIQALTHEQGLAFLQASNFSIGVNLFIAVNTHLSRYMADQTEYRCQIEETHHVQKKDAPSGTAIALAEAVINASKGTLADWTLSQGQEVGSSSIPIRAYREDDVPGTHTLTWSGPVDMIQLTHEARNRDGFGYGAWLAAHWIANKQGVFTMADVLGLNGPADQSDRFTQ